MSQSGEMSAHPALGAAATGRPDLPGGFTLWLRQVLALARLDLRKSLFGRRALLVYAFAALPVFVVMVLGVVKRPGGDPLFGTIGDAHNAYAMIFQTLVLRGVVFFGCVGIFTNLFRGEVLDCTLPYLLLWPCRREVLVLGKYVAGWTITATLFVSTTVISFVLLYLPFGVSRTMEDLTGGPGGAQLFAYVSVVLLACLGYGSVFLILGLVFRNPILPAFIVLGWEALHFLLPPMLKKISVIHYLKSLIPLPMSEGPFAVVAEPPAVWVSVLGLLLLTAAVLVASSFFVRRFEVRYGED